MISDQDITKLKKVFATKEDLKQFATKDDLKRFATKEELADVRLELGEVKDRLGVVDDKVDTIITKLDGIAGAIQDLREENAAGAVHLARHDRQIEALAKGTGIKLPN